MLSYRREAMQGNPPARRRIVALTLTLLLHILVFAILLVQKGIEVPMAHQGRLTAFLLMPQAKEKSAHRTATQKSRAKAAEQAESQAQASAEQPPPPPPTPSPPTTDDRPLNFLQISSADFAASNIANKQNHKATAPTATSGSDSKSDYGPSGGPTDAALFAADWYRRPTNTELATYVPPNAPPTGWGMIACKTVERYHVDDCYILGESPRGSGFGRGVLNAAWQFLVLPPRMNGKAMVGSWVRIRIEYTQQGGFQPGD